MRTLLSLSVAVLAGLLMTRVAKPLKLPSVTAYLVAGVLIGPYCLGLLGIEGLGFPTQEDVDSLSLISEVALGFIAFSIGSEFRVSELKHTGKQAFVIGVLQALAATFLIDIALVAIALVTNGKLTIAQAITLGAIGTATAPAATLMVVRQYKAKGPLVDLLLPIVALDDAVGLVVFAVSFGIAKALNTGSFDVISIVVDPLIEIVCSLALGALGMCVTARQLGAEGDLIRNITLFAILIYELVGPLLTKMALQAAGEIHPMEDAVKNRRQINLEKANAEKK